MVHKHPLGKSCCHWDKNNIKSALEISAASRLALSFQCSDSPYQCICPKKGFFWWWFLSSSSEDGDYDGGGDRMGRGACLNEGQIPKLKIRFSVRLRITTPKRVVVSCLKVYLEIGLKVVLFWAHSLKYFLSATKLEKTCKQIHIPM